MLMYANDVLLFAECPKQLEGMIDNLYEKCIKWSLMKSEVMVIKKGGGRIRSVEQRKLGDLNIKLSEKYKYLGVEITPSFLI